MALPSSMAPTRWREWSTSSFATTIMAPQATVEYGNTLDKDSGEDNASFIFGAGDEKTQVAGVINFYHRNSIANRDRGFSAVPPFLSTNASPYNLQLSRDAVVAAIQAADGYAGGTNGC